MDSNKSSDNILWNMPRSFKKYTFMLLLLIVMIIIETNLPIRCEKNVDISGFELAIVSGESFDQSLDGAGFHKPYANCLPF